MPRYNSLVLSGLSAICLAVAPASAMRSHAIDAPLSVSRNAPAAHDRGLHILLTQAQAPGRPLTQQEQATTRAPERPVRDPLVRVEPPAPSQPHNPFPQRPANEPRLTNPLSR